VRWLARYLASGSLRLRFNILRGNSEPAFPPETSGSQAARGFQPDSAVPLRGWE
jgi:hypothetical protein